MLALYLESSFANRTGGTKAGFRVAGKPFAEDSRKARRLHGMTEFWFAYGNALKQIMKQLCERQPPM